MTLPGQLTQLENVNLIGVVAGSPELEYAFRHVLIQEAAYGSLLRQQRVAWHRAAAEAIESLYPVAAVPDAVAPVLAHHYAAAGQPGAALRYYAQAGEAAFARYANAEAATFFESAVALALDHPACPPEELRRLFERWGRSLQLSAQLTVALAVYTRMESVAEQRADRALLLAALMARATMQSTASFVHDEAAAQAALERARALARELDDHAAETHINWTLMLRNVMSGGDPQERLALGEAALRSARALGLREQLAYVLTDLWYAYAGLGRWDEGDQSLTEAQSLLVGLGNPALLSESFNRLAISRYVRGDFSSALDHIQSAYAVAEQMDSPHMRGLSRVFAGQAHTQRGELAQALSLMQEVITLGEATGNVTALIGTRADLALTLGYLGDMGAAKAQVTAALAAGRAQFPLLLPWPRAVAARLLLAQGQLLEAEAHLTGLDLETLQRQIGFMVTLWANVGLARLELALARDNPAEAVAQAARLLRALEAGGVVFLQPETRFLRAQALARLGDFPAAQADLQAALDLAHHLGARLHLWRFHAALAALAEAINAPDLAVTHRRSARSELEWLLLQAPAAQRDLFRARPEVAALLTHPATASST